MKELPAGKSLGSVGHSTTAVRACFVVKRAVTKCKALAYCQSMYEGRAKSSLVFLYGIGPMNNLNSRSLWCLVAIKLPLAPQEGSG